MDALTLKDLDKLVEFEGSLQEFRTWISVDRSQLRTLLSLARRQLEQPLGSPEGVRPPASACAPPVHSDAPPVVQDWDADLILDSYLRSSHDWLTDAYHNEPCVNRTLKECALRGKAIQDVWPLLASRMYELKNTWEMTAMGYAKAGEQPIAPFELKPRAVESDSSTPATDQSTEGKKDTERLDWLERQGGIGVDENRHGEYNHYAGGLNFPSLRAMVDKAMAEEGGAA